jgi:hypothetical protein
MNIVKMRITLPFVSRYRMIKYERAAGEVRKIKVAGLMHILIGRPDMRIRSPSLAIFQFGGRISTEVGALG